MLRTVSLAAGLLGPLPIAAVALGATPVGAEFQVNAYTTGSQSRPAVGVDADGDFVVVWQSLGSPSNDNDGASVQARLYDAAGAPFGVQFQVNSYTMNGQRRPRVSVEPDGDFVVVWHSDGSAGSDGSFSSVQARRYDASGDAIGNQFQVNTYTTSYQEAASVSVEADGDFVVVWHSLGSAGSDSSTWSVQGQRFDSSGAAVGGQFQVNTYTTNSQRHARVSIDGDGDFVVVWASYNGSTGTDTDGYSIQAQRYDSSGAAVGGEFQVNSSTTGDQLRPSVSTDSDGDFVVVWHSYSSAGSDSAPFSVQGQRYDTAGAAVGGEFQVNTFTTASQYYPSVAHDADGDFAVVWQSQGSSGSDGSGASVQGQRYDSSGAAVGGEFQVNTYTTSQQKYPSVSAESDGDFVVVWQSNGSAGSDSSSYSVQGQRYSVPPEGSLALDFTAGTTGNVLNTAATAGWEFTVSSPVSVNGLGIWDETPSGLTNTHTVGLWTAGGTLKTSVVISTGSSVGSTSPDGEWRFEAISPVVLAPGTYVVGATYQAVDADSIRTEATASMHPAITFVSERECTGGCSGLTFPDASNPSLDDGAFGPNLLLAPDGDSDGVSDAAEDAAPNGGDGNDDGTADSVQSDVASLPDAETGASYLTLEARGACATLLDVIARSEAEVAQENATAEDGLHDYPFGLVGFRAPCASLSLKIYYHGTSQAPSFYRKYGPTIPGDPASAAWYALPTASFGTDVVGGQTVGTATLSLTDGVRGDDTGVDGEIVNDGGIAEGALPVPALRPAGLLALTGLLLGAGALLLHRRHRLRE